MTAEEYRRFAAMEARGRSPLYEQLAGGVADDRELLDLLAGLPPAKRQPNLLFAATRHVAGTPSGYAEFRRSVLDHREAVVATMLARRTQTNEPARCAALYPLLASLPQPLALLEVGASAGLCLLPDRYGYDYDGSLAGDVGSPVRLRCRVEGEPLGEWPGPGAVTVAWRAGIDLNPLDVTDPDDVRWLRTLVWPEHRHRLDRLDAAIAVAREDPPRIVRGDLNARLGEVAAQAPPHATLVVVHTAVLYYVPEDDRRAFVAQVEGLGCHWISQEAPDVLPGIAARLGRRPPEQTTVYVVALDGRPAAFSALHGGWLRRPAIDPATDA
ncbi:DUF2332 domain-containing protein [Nonomuraea deserti]|uniref:DUF2332 domain-containing protein n=1 Tax=Nonomuraea deserti TaxID=1848322 RepID=A0A4R4VNM4_9ACTN|nr:DUF2332 domain-containing protein [Nonomuraea deserti]TDD07282.1 DUF2332 domain-containing protein [Nonomuraea deserti]